MQNPTKVITPDAENKRLYRLESKDGDHHQLFQSWEDYLETADKGLVQGDRGRSSRDPSYGGRFYDSANITECLGRAKGGWPENAEKIRTLSASLTDEILSCMKVTDFRRTEEEGMGVDLSAYLEGEPDCILKHVEEDATGDQTIRIVYNGTVSCIVNAEVMQAKGAAIAALTQALELAGKRCEVTLAFCCRGYGDDGVSFIETHVPIKRDGEPVQIDQLAFALASADVFRRLGFAAWEALPEKLRMAQGAYSGGGYGMPSSPKFAEGDIIIDTEIGYGGSMQWTNPAAAKQWVLEHLRAQGVELKDSEGGGL